LEENLNEAFFPVYPDNEYRRVGRHIVLCTLESMVPRDSVLDPSIWAVGGNTEYTWGKVQWTYTRLPQARRNLLPMHYYVEYVDSDYVTYVGAPLTNRSWFLQEAAAKGVIPTMMADAVLVALQENYAVEVTERRLWKLLAANLLTPLMRQLEVPRERVVFLEQVCNEEVARSAGWLYKYRSPKYLDRTTLDHFLKVFRKDV